MISLVPAAEPKSFICKFREIESFSELSTITSVFNNHLREQMSLMRLSLITRAAAGLLGNGLAE